MRCASFDRLGRRGAGHHRMPGRLVRRVVRRVANDVEPPELERRDHQQ